MYKRQGLDTDELTELSQYYARIRPVYKQFESGMDAPNTEIYKYEIPGGQYSNLLAQVKEMGAADDFEEIKGLYRDANHLLGNIVKVTPSSKVVGDFAIFMFKNGLTKDNILEACLLYTSIMAFIPPYGFRAAGDVKFTMTTSMLCMWLCRVVLAMVLARVFHMGPIAVWIGMFTEWTIRAIIYTVRFRNRTWLANQVI